MANALNRTPKLKQDQEIPPFTHIEPLKHSRLAGLDKQKTSACQQAREIAKILWFHDQGRVTDQRPTKQDIHQLRIGFCEFMFRIQQRPADRFTGF